MWLDNNEKNELLNYIRLGFTYNLLQRDHTESISNNKLGVIIWNWRSTGDRLTAMQVNVVLGHASWCRHINKHDPISGQQLPDGHTRDYSQPPGNNLGVRAYWSLPFIPGIGRPGKRKEGTVISAGVLLTRRRRPSGSLQYGWLEKTSTVKNTKDFRHTSGGLKKWNGTEVTAKKSDIHHQSIIINQSNRQTVTN